MRLAELTTLQVGGDAKRVLAPETTVELVAAVRSVWAVGDELLLLGGGSNLVIGDEPYEGTVVRVLTRGIERLASPVAAEGVVRLRVQAGEPWDALVAHAVGNGWSGIEALSGIPGSCGAGPIQNIGAYGQEIADCLVAIEFLDAESDEILRIPAEELGLGYRTSALKEGREGVVLSIELELGSDAAHHGLSQPVGYAQLASALGVRLGDRVSVAELRATVLALRGSKGMLLDPADPHSVSAGSFFTNPIVSENFARQLPAETPHWPVEAEPENRVTPLGEQPQPPALGGRYRVKLSAAWLIEHSGIGRGFSLPGSHAAVSPKHTLALVNRAGGSAAEIAELARYIQTRVFAEFGVLLQPEPVFVNLAL